MKLQTLSAAQKTVAALCASAIVLSSLGSVSASASEPTSGSELVDEAVVPMVLPLDEAASLTTARSIGATLDEKVVGYSYNNGNVSGEFYPTASRSVEQFAAEFENDFGTEPQIVALVIEAVGSDLVDATGEEIRNQEEAFAALPLDPELHEAFRPAVPEASGDSKSSSRTTGGEWRPEYVETEIDKVSDVVTFTQYVDWGPASSPLNIPENYGMETDFNIYNPDNSNVGIDPLCPAGQEFDFFAAKNQWISWQIITFGSTAGLGPLSEYRDITQGDACTRASFAVGIRYPSNIPSSGGDYALTTRIWIEEGTETENAIGLQMSLLDDAKCRDDEANDYTPWLGYCMGLWEVEPEGVPVSRPILSASRGWVAPDRCWASADFGETNPVPLSSCSQQNASALGVPVSAMTVTGDTPESRAYEFFVELPTPAPAWLDTNFPGAIANDGEVSQTVGDVRVWIDGNERPVDWEGWRVEVPSDLRSLTLTNSSGVVAMIDNGTIVTLNALAHDGVISFRSGDAPPTILRFDEVTPSVNEGGDEVSSIKAEQCWGSEPEWPVIHVAPPIPVAQSSPATISNETGSLSPSYTATYNDGAYVPDANIGCLYAQTVPLTMDSQLVAMDLTGWDYMVVTDNSTGFDQWGHPVVAADYGDYILRPDDESWIEYSYWDGMHYSPFALTTQGADGNDIKLKYSTYSDWWMCWDVDDCEYRSSELGSVEVTSLVSLSDGGLIAANDFRKMEYFGGTIKFLLDDDPVTIKITPQYGYSFWGVNPYNHGGGCDDCGASRTGGP